MVLNEQVKQKQKGVKRMVLPSVEGQESGKWIVIDSGKFLLTFLPCHYACILIAVMQWHFFVEINH